MPTELTRIFSDVHFGDPASRVDRLAQLRPLLGGVGHLVLNGDTLDTRPGPRPQFTAEIRAAVLAFFPQHVPRVTFTTGNHDADLSPTHALDLAAGKIFVTHGDIFYDDIVPWSRDAPLIGAQIAAALAALPAAERQQLAPRLAAWRRVAAAIPQRHQSEPRSLRYFFRYVLDTVWPPTRVWRVLQVWRHAPTTAAAFARVHRPAAKFVAVGHTHRPGVWRTATDITVINTGSFSRGLRGCLIDIEGDRVVVRHVVTRGGEFHAGDAMAEFSLADANASSKLAS